MPPSHRQGTFLIKRYYTRIYTLLQISLIVNRSHALGFYSRKGAHSVEKHPFALLFGRFFPSLVQAKKTPSGVATQCARFSQKIEPRGRPPRAKRRRHSPGGCPKDRGIKNKGLAKSFGQPHVMECGSDLLSHLVGQYHRHWRA